jgi:hypothetical protein
MCHWSSNVFPHLKVWVRVIRGIPHSEGLFKFVTQYMLFLSINELKTQLLEFSMESCSFLLY